MKKYLIIPGCSDLNRGDQALVWETMKIAQASGHDGKYMFLSGIENNIQSINHGLTPVRPILRHPSRVSKYNNNISYGVLLKILWGTIAMWDLVWSLILLLISPCNAAVRLLPSSIRSSINEFKQAETVFVKGGGFIHAYGGIVSTYFIYFVLYHIWLALRLGKKVYIMPNSFGPFKGPMVKFLVKHILEKCEFISAREKISAKALSEVLGRDIEVFPDLAFSLDASGKEAIFNQLKNMGVPLGDKKCIAITARPYRFPKSENPQESYKSYIEAVRCFAEHIYQSGYFPVFVVHALSLTAHEDDRSCIKEIIKDLEQGHYAYFDNTDFDCTNLKALYSCFDAVVATRFHSAIFALGGNIPVLAITYGGNKGDGIMQDMNLLDYVVPIEKASFKLLQEKFTILLRDTNLVKKKIEKYTINANIARAMLINKIQNR